tara:strand:- start:37 stop:1071 length:1035 start_codon:yes stop_codon:yes gene_type:complete
MKLQTVLGAKVDGGFGKGTADALINKSNLTALPADKDGVLAATIGDKKVSDLMAAVQLPQQGDQGGQQGAQQGGQQGGQGGGQQGGQGGGAGTQDWQLSNIQNPENFDLPNSKDIPVNPQRHSRGWTQYYRGVPEAAVKALQSAVGVNDDGDFGNGTRAALLSRQKRASIHTLSELPATWGQAVSLLFEMPQEPQQEQQEQAGATGQRQQQMQLRMVEDWEKSPSYPNMWVGMAVDAFNQYVPVATVRKDGQTVWTGHIANRQSNDFEAAYGKKVEGFLTDDETKALLSGKGYGTGFTDFFRRLSPNFDKDDADRNKTRREQLKEMRDAAKAQREMRRRTRSTR